MKSKSIFFVPVILIILQLLLVLIGCQDLNNPKQATININLDLSKLIKESRSQTTQGSSEYILKILAYDATLYKTGGNIEKLPLLTQTENKVDTNGIVKTRLNLEIGLNVIFVAKLYEMNNNKINNVPLCVGNSEIVKIKPTDNKVNLVLTKVQGDVDFDFSIHEHTFAKEWSMDKTHHWKWSTCGHDVVGEKAEHAMGEYVSNNDATPEKDGTKTKKCTVCNYAETVIDEGTKEHSHTFEDNWTNDATHHWKKSTCGHDVVNENTEHSFTEYISNDDATTESDGTKTRNCTVCEYVETVTDVGSRIVVPEGLRTGDYVLTDKTYVRKEYFSELTQEERGKIFGIVLITDSNIPLILGTQFSTNESKWTASSVGINTYLSEIATGVNGNLNSGYTFTGDLDGSDNWEYICTVDAENTEESLMPEKYPAFYNANIYASYAGLTDTDFAEGWYIPAIYELYEMYKNIETISDSLSNLQISLPSTTTSFWSSSVPSAVGQTAYKLDYSTGEITNVDRGTDSYYVWAFHKFNNEFECYEYPDAEITSVELETTIIGEPYTGTIPVRITGENLLAYDITSQDSNLSNINYVTNTEATAEIDCDNSVGSHLITINCGTGIGTANYNIVEAEKCFSVGDILFTDGTRMKAEDVQYGVPDEQISKAFGVIASTPYGGVKGKALGLQKSSSTLPWAANETTGYSTNFTEIQSGYSGSSSAGYTFTGDLDGSDNWEYICSIDPTGTVDAATNYPAFNFANTYGTTAGLTGTEYEDGWYLPAIAELYQVYENKTAIQEGLTAAGGFTISTSYYWSSSQNASSSNLAYNLNFFNGSVYYVSLKSGKDDVLVVQAFNPEQFNDYEVTTVPSITNIEIETAGEGYTGDLVVTITGNNLKGHPVTCSDASFGNVKYISDTEVIATITCTGTAGSSDITVTCGSSTVTGIVKVLNYNIGYIVLSDGSFVSKDDFNSSTMTPIAVVVEIKNNGGQAVGVGLQRGTGLQWAPSRTTGYSTNFTEIQSGYSGSSSAGYTFTGDLDGNDNWDYICSIDPEGTVDAATNYPAFNFANTYGTTAGLTGTEYEDGWYLPAIAELYQVYENKTAIQEGLTAAGGFTISTSYYWSSSQYASDDDRAYLLNFFNGDVYDYDKIYSGNVLVVQAFNAQ